MRWHGLFSEVGEVYRHRPWELSAPWIGCGLWFRSWWEVPAVYRPADETCVEFGLKLNGQVGVVLADTRVRLISRSCCSGTVGKRF